MEDIYQILDMISCSNNHPMVLATIIKVEGSSYKKEGSTMLLIENQCRVGMLSVGCLEEDLEIRAKQVWLSEEPSTVRYDLSSEDDLSWGQGAGCNGVITILLEPVKEVLLKKLFTLKECLDSQKTVTRIIQFTESLEMKADLYVVEDGSSFGYGDVDHIFMESLLKKKNPYDMERGLKTLGGSYDLLFINQIIPKPRLYLIGGGEDARPLVSLAARVGFHISIIDWRTAICNEVYFPNADEFIIGKPEEVIKRLSFTPRDFVVIMTHQFQKDQYFLSYLLEHNLYYLGILGPRKRTERLLRGCELPETIHSPIGLAIGAKGAEEIAISIVGEMIDKMRNHKKYSQ
ncbi:XdhC family protein [Bacillus sp. RG28]|uniref:XdhC family protein n=1 Tax=Gottfriedia endophytica TaxID=2820819 RepID=A0A940NLY0_9BACI|nr:XdhC/CoxI family protein [Gottfriedia endophytica]MBP0726687.1 XdhC family protein [Gottfriedia endophytica]